MASDGVESTVGELIALRNKPRLEGRELERAIQLLRWLKSKGFSPKQISDMTNGRWKEATIKSYTKGILTRPVAPAVEGSGGEPSQLPQEEPKKLLAIIGDMAARGLDLDAVAKINAFLDDLEKQGISKDDAITLMAEIQRSSMPLPILLMYIRAITSSGVSLEEIGKILSYIKSLIDKNIDEKMLGHLVDIIANQGEGDFNKTLQFLNKFDKIHAVESRIEDASLHEEELKTRINKLQSDSNVLAERNAAARSRLDLYDELQMMGFHDDVLVKLKEICKKHGGPDQVLTAVNSYIGKAELDKDIERTRQAAKNERANLAKAEAESLNLRYIQAICAKLLDLNYDIATIERIYEIAKRYGDPREVMRALSEYGSISMIKEIRFKVEDYDRIKKTLDEVLKQLPDTNGRALKLLRQILDELVLPKEQRTYDKELVDSGLPELVNKLMEDEIDKRLKHAGSEALQTKIRNEVQRQVEEYMRMWPSHSMWERDPQKVKAMEQKQFANPFVVLKGRWSFPCSTCGHDHTLEIKTIYDVQQVLMNDYVRVPSGPIDAYFRGSHSVLISLKDIVECLLKSRKL